MNAMIPEYKKATIDVYDKQALEYDQEKKSYIETLGKEDFDHFIKSMKKIKGKKILDLGSGPGRDALLFKQKRFYSVCVDLSKKMIKICKKNDLDSCITDFCDLHFRENSFDGIWASYSLVHIPKNDLPNILIQIKKILKPNGIFLVSVFEGIGEGPRKNDKRAVGKIGRYFAYYQQDELKKILSKFFEIVKERKIEPDETHMPGLCFECINRK